MSEPIVDVTSWAPAGVEHRGKKPKQWLRDPDSTLWLWKESTWNRVQTGDYRKGDDWAEVAAFHLGRLLDIPVAETRLAAHVQKPGVISRNVVPSDLESLRLGNEVLADAGIEIHEPTRRAGYTLGAVDKSIEAITPAAGFESAFEQFVSYLVLDALIGNTDRHEENWAVIESAKGSRRMSPSFDHASSLGFLLSDGQRRRYLDEDVVATWAAGARTKFSKRPHPCEVAAEGLAMISQPTAQRLLDRVAGLQGLELVLDGLPSDRLSEPAALFAARVFGANRDRILSVGIRTLPT